MLKQLFLITTLLFINESSHADRVNHSSGYGFWITPGLEGPDKINKKIGEDVNLRGSICAAKVKHNENFKCQNILDKDIEVLATFPDGTKDVSRSLTINKGKKEWTYSFKTGPLNENDTNVFTLIIGRRNPKLGSYLKSLAKIQKRLNHIERQIEELRPTQKHYQQKLSFLKHYKAIFIKTIIGIEKVIDSNPDVLARLSKPLLVNNKLNSHLAYSSIFNGNKLTLTSLPGVVLENQTAAVEASVFKLDGKNKWNPKVDWGRDSGSGDINRSNTLTLTFNEEVISQKEFQNLLIGEEIVLNSSVKPSESTKSNLLEFQFFDNQTGGLSIIKLPLPVIRREVSAPVISLMSPTEGLDYTNSLPLVQAEISSLIDKIDRDSVEITANGTPLSLDISSTDDDKTLSISSILTEFEDGEIELIVSGADVSGNQAQPITRTFTFDSIRPQISSSLLENTVVGLRAFSFTVAIQDASPTSTKVFHNGTAITETSSKEFQVDVELINGPNNFEIQAVDKATNIAELIFPCFHGHFLKQHDLIVAHTP